MILIGKTALVTGGSRGIGKAIVLSLAAEGADIAFTYLSNKKAADKVVEEVTKIGRRCIALQADGTDIVATQGVVDKIIETFGEIDILVNNAGITRDSLLIRMSEQQWEQVMDANMKAAFHYCRPVAQHMLRRRSGSIINISSVVGMFGNAGQCNYAASKGALVAFTKSLSKELGPRNVRANCVAPGFILTEMTEQLPEEVRKQYLNDIALRRYGTPEDVANIVVFLASDKAGYITGEVINCSGNIKS